MASKSAYNPQYNMRKAIKKRLYPQYNMRKAIKKQLQPPIQYSYWP